MTADDWRAIAQNAIKKAVELDPVPQAVQPTDTVTISRALLQATYNMVMHLECDCEEAPWDELIRLVVGSEELEPAAAKRKGTEGDAAAEPKKPKNALATESTTAQALLRFMS